MQLHYNCVPECSFLTFFIGSQVRTHNLLKNYISAKTNSEYTEHLDNHSTQLTSGPTWLDIGPSWFSYWAELVGPSLLVGRVDCKTYCFIYTWATTFIKHLKFLGIIPVYICKIVRKQSYFAHLLCKYIIWSSELAIGRWFTYSNS